MLAYSVTLSLIISGGIIRSHPVPKKPTTIIISEDFDMVAMETVTNQYLGGDTSLVCSAETQSKIDA